MGGAYQRLTGELRRTFLKILPCIAYRLLRQSLVFERRPRLGFQDAGRAVNLIKGKIAMLTDEVVIVSQVFSL
jgi:hypothetical protein